jgi:hypothetical protein
MRWHWSLVLSLAVAVGVSAPGAAQAPAAKDAPAAKEAPKQAQRASPDPKAGLKVATPRKTARVRSKRSFHARVRQRHRWAYGVRRNRWQYVWVYRALEPRGDRYYHYVRRSFGGYFARGFAWR